MGYKITKRWHFIPFCGPQEAIDEVPKKLGQYFMTKDGRAVYFDIDDENRIRLSGEGGGGGDPVITTPLTSQVEIGNVKVGKTYPTGTYLETIIRDMLTKYTKPSISLTINPSATLYDAATGKITSVTMSAVAVKNSKNITKITFSVNGTVVNTITTGVASGGNFQYPYTPAIPITSDCTFSASVTDGTETSTATISVKFVGKSFYGTMGPDITVPTAAQIKNLNSTLKTSKAYTYSGITMTFGKVVYAYPKSLGAITKVMDTVNNLNYTDTFSKSETTIDGMEYYVYTQIEPSASDGVTLAFT